MLSALGFLMVLNIVDIFHKPLRFSHKYFLLIQSVLIAYLATHTSLYSNILFQLVLVVMLLATIDQFTNYMIFVNNMLEEDWMPKQDYFVPFLNPMKDIKYFFPKDKVSFNYFGGNYGWRFLFDETSRVVLNVINFALVIVLIFN